VQALSQALTAFEESERKVPAEWKHFHGSFHIGKTKEALSVALSNVLKAIVWSGDSCSHKASLAAGGPYADCTMLLKNLGAMHLKLHSSPLKCHEE
jgi:hypothetical protein